jgi:hypothetical protein
VAQGAGPRQPWPLAQAQRKDGRLVLDDRNPADTMGGVADAGPSPATHPQLNRLPPGGDWRGSDRAVVLLTFDVDAETAVLAEGEHYSGTRSTRRGT